MLTVVEETGNGESVARVTPEDLDDVGREWAAADHERAMGDHPPPARREDEAAGDEPAEHDEAEPGKHDEQERLDALAVVAQGKYRRHEGGGDQESPHQHGELVEHREVQACPVASAAGEQGDRDDGGREDRFGVLREPQHRQREEDRVDRQDEHPRLPVHRRPETQERSRGTRRQGLVVDEAGSIDPPRSAVPPRPPPVVRRACSVLCESRRQPVIPTHRPPVASRVARRLTPSVTRSSEQECICTRCTGEGPDRP